MDRAAWWATARGVAKTRTPLSNYQCGFRGGSDGKEAARSAGDPGWIPGSGASWRRDWHPAPVLLPGESDGQRSLAGCSPWARKRVRRDD